MDIRQLSGYFMSWGITKKKKKKEKEVSLLFNHFVHCRVEVYGILNCNFFPIRFWPILNSRGLKVWWKRMVFIFQEKLIGFSILFFLHLFFLYIFFKLFYFIFVLVKMPVMQWLFLQKTKQKTSSNSNQVCCIRFALMPLKKNPYLALFEDSYPTSTP